MNKAFVGTAYQEGTKSIIANLNKIAAHEISAINLCCIKRYKCVS